ncbi:uncharacterized protein LOC127528746 [Erpetoichthys calabaricus]|uniref:uncharacterized protein LOC127528746 n=1 Tax=Erpetoichthys calabaricus TaxID=27687 RepID=UPI0022343FE3|nr:uncharacterized protein LOC127528746 [Erpetoichthys calabaricus]
MHPTPQGNAVSQTVSGPVSDFVFQVRLTDVVDQKGAAEKERLQLGKLQQQDSLKFQIKLQNKPATRRGILSVVSSVYDPLGFLAPALLPAKLILRDLCKEKFGLDEEVEVKHIQKWKKWMDDLQLLTDYKVNRCFKPPGFGTIKTAQMHHFADASEDGYSTVTYLVLTNEEGQRHCSFLMGKSRVAPLKQVTIPRLELTAAVVAVKMDKMLKGELQMPLEESTFWTDSTTVLKYISNESTRFKTFVANRISVIRDHSQPSQWRYVTSVLNPADQASRGLSIENFLKSTIWSQALVYQEAKKTPEREKESKSSDKESLKNAQQVLKKNLSEGKETYKERWFIRLLAMIPQGDSPPPVAILHGGPHQDDSKKSKLGICILDPLITRIFRYSFKRITITRDLNHDDFMYYILSDGKTKVELVQ